MQYRVQSAVQNDAVQCNTVYQLMQKDIPGKSPMLHLPVPVTGGRLREFTRYEISEALIIKVYLVVGYISLIINKT